MLCYDSVDILGIRIGLNVILIGTAIVRSTVSEFVFNMILPHDCILLPKKQEAHQKKNFILITHATNLF